MKRYVNAFTNYSFQADPEVEGSRPATRSTSRRTTASTRASTVSQGRYFGNLGVSYSGDAYWQDVLDARFAGTTDAYTLVNGGFGVRWAGGRVVTSVKGANLGNTEVQQHIFGDVLRRQVVGEVRFSF